MTSFKKIYFSQKMKKENLLFFTRLSWSQNYCCLSLFRPSHFHKKKIHTIRPLNLLQIWLSQEHPKAESPKWQCKICDSGGSSHYQFITYQYLLERSRNHALVIFSPIGGHVRKQNKSWRLEKRRKEEPRVLKRNFVFRYLGFRKLWYEDGCMIIDTNDYMYIYLYREDT